MGASSLGGGACSASAPALVALSPVAAVDTEDREPLDDDDTGSEARFTEIFARREKQAISTRRVLDARDLLQTGPVNHSAGTAGGLLVSDLPRREERKERYRKQLEGPWIKAEA